RERLINVNGKCCSFFNCKRNEKILRGKENEEMLNGRCERKKMFSHVERLSGQHRARRRRLMPVNADQPA
ncbi:MAG: hypothetical protein ACXU7D_10000, partial [Burkholderiaceae bacterium]